MVAIFSMGKYGFRKKLNIRSSNDLEKRLDVKDNATINILKNINNLYIKKPIKKTDSSERILYIPKKPLKYIQGKIYNIILKPISLPPCVHGGVPGRSIITNASCHIGKEYVINIDIKNFFNSVHYPKILELLNALNCSCIVSRILTRLTTYKRFLPQGAPTSPFLSNMVLFNLDRRFVNLCKNNGLMYTRYFDDITISGGKRAIHKKMEKEYAAIINTEGYNINYKKLTFHHRSQKQIVNGILVNNGLNLDSEFKKGLEKYIDGLCKFGLGFLNEECFYKEKDSILGKIRFLGQFDKDAANELMKKINLVNWGF